MENQTASKVFGLDLIRALAISLVVLSHGVFVQGSPLQRGPVAWLVGILGVEVFFALSGFLIGTLLLDLQNNGWTGRGVRTFLLRRWMRTLPLYYVVLIAEILWPSLDLNERPNLWPYAALVQNALTPMPRSNWFGTSWSLTVEEWSYIALPLMAAALSGLRFVKNPVLCSALLLCAAGLVFRIAGIPEPGTWDALHGSVISRLDAIAYGVLLAYFHKRNPVQLARICLLASVVTVPALVASIMAFRDIPVLFGWYGRIVSLPVFSLLVCSLLPLIMGLKRPAIIGTAISFLARISYALYLAHFPIMFLAMRWPPMEYAWVIWLFVSLATAAVLSYSIEQPIMRLRPGQSRSSPQSTTPALGLAT